MSGRVLVVGLGPGEPSLVSPALGAALSRIPPAARFVRTRRHPTADAVGEAVSFDDVYRSASSLEEVYPEIVERLVAAAAGVGEVLYAVPGSPLVAERSVALLRADTRVEVEVVPAVSFLDLAWDRLGVDPVAAGVRLVDGQRFAVEAAGARGPLLVGQCDSRSVLSAVKLAVDDGPAVTVMAHLGLADESVRAVAWEDLDREVQPDHLTTLWIPRLAAPVAAELTRFAELVRTLRERCPWDKEQTHHSLKRHLLEETYEVLEAIDEVGSDPYHLEEELGDLLFQVAFHATLAAEEGLFDLADVARGIHDKLVARHPHVFGAVQAATSDAVVSNWEAIKRQEKGRTRVLEGIPAALPSLLHAEKVQRRAASVGFDWPDTSGARAKVAEELAELDAADADVADELGDVLFAAVNLSRHLGVDAEGALRAATAKFVRRFERVEDMAAQGGRPLSDLDLAALDGLWDQAKAEEGGAG